MSLRHAEEVKYSCTTLDHIFQNFANTLNFSRERDVLSRVAHNFAKFSGAQMKAKRKGLVGRRWRLRNGVKVEVRVFKGDHSKCFGPQSPSSFYHFSTLVPSLFLFQFLHSFARRARRPFLSTDAAASEKTQLHYFILPFFGKPWAYHHNFCV